MIAAKVIERAEILAPNKEHKSFTRTNTFLEPSTSIAGKPTMITGLRKGQPFDYRLFEINNSKFIYLNKTNIKPTEMKATEVKLGADAQRTPTVIDTKAPGNSLSNHPKIFGTVIGVAFGFAWSHYLKHDNKKKLGMSALGGVAGFAIGAYIQHRRAISITAPAAKHLK